jgi:hypothetical protein
MIRSFPSLRLSFKRIFVLSSLLGVALWGDCFAASIDVGRTLNIDWPAGDKPVGFTEIRWLSRAMDGEYLVAGRQDLRHLRYLRLNPDLSVAWQRTTDQGWGPFAADFIVEAPGGGYWVGGIAASRDGEKDRAVPPYLPGNASYSFVQRVDANGGLVWQRPISAIGASHYVYCGIPSGNNLLVVGKTMTSFKQADGNSTGTASPWIAMLDSSGSFQWQRTISEEGNDFISEVTGGHHHGCGAIAQSHGGFIVAFTVTALDKSMTGNVSEALYGSAYLPAVHQRLLIRFDADGNEKASSRDKYHGRGDDDFLVESGGKLLIVGNYRPAVQPPVNIRPNPTEVLRVIADSRSQAGIEIGRVNADLTVSDKQVIALQGLADRLEAATTDSAGGLLVGGCDANGNDTVARLDGSLRLQVVGVGGGMCSTMDIVQSSDAASRWLLLGNRFKLIELKLSQ